MKNQKNYFGFYIGIFGLFITPLLIILAFTQEPTYDPLLQTISKLGITPNGELTFIIGTVIGGSSIILFHYLLFNESQPNDKNIYYIKINGLLSGIGLIGVGIIQDFQDDFHRILHWVSAATFFLCTMIFIFLFCKYLKNSQHREKFLFVTKSAIIPVTLAGSYMIIALISQKFTLAGIDFKINVIWQKLTVLSFIFWYFFLFYYMIKNKSLNFDEKSIQNF